MLPLKLVVKFSQHLCMMILQICCATFYMITNIFGLKSRIISLLNLFRYFFPLSKIFWDEILHDSSFRFVPLLFTSYKIFNDNFYIIWYIINDIVHDGSYKSVPLCFTFLLYFEMKLCIIVLFKFVPLPFILSRVFNDQNVHVDYIKSVPVLFISSGIF